MTAPTARQLEVHAAMLEYQQKHGLPPTLRELGELVGISSTNGVKDFLKALERKGLAKQHRAGASRAWVAINPQPQEGTST